VIEPVELSQRLWIVRPDGVAQPERGNTRIAGRGVEGREQWRLGELPGERVLASARPDQEHFHGSILRGS